MEGETQINNGYAETLYSAAELLLLDKYNARFGKDGDFLSLKLSSEAAEAVFRKKGEDEIGDEMEGRKPEDFEYYRRIRLHRAFPFKYPFSYISVFNADDEEIGIIEDVKMLSDEDIPFIECELEREYFSPKILKIKSITSHRGFTLWKIESDIGELELTLRDTFHSIIHADEDRLFVLDNSGNRYEIESLSALDSKSRKKIEIYL